MLAVSISLSLLLLCSLPMKTGAFQKIKIQFVDMIKTFEGNIELKFPIDVYAGRNGDIYILDSGLQMILIFDKDLLSISTIGKTHGLRSPMSVAVNDKGMIYVSEETAGEKQKGRITVFDPLGRKREVIEFKGFPGAEGFLARDMAIDGEGNLYLAGGETGPLIIISNDGKFIRNIQPMERSSENKEIKTDVARVDLKGDLIYLLSEWQGHVYVFNLKGERLSVFGKKGGSPGKLSRAQGLAVDPIEGFTYVMDYMRHTLLVYDSSGSFMNEFGGEGWDPGWFSFPKDICVDGQGRLFVADTFNKRVQVFLTSQ